MITWILKYNLLFVLVPILFLCIHHDYVAYLYHGCKGIFNTFATISVVAMFKTYYAMATMNHDKLRSGLASASSPPGFLCNQQYLSHLRESDP